MSKNFLITGRPGIGKTTAVVRVVELLRREGIEVGGFISEEIRVRGTRVGFRVVDLKTGRQGYLARVGRGRGPRVGKYVVDLEEFERIGVRAVESAISEAEVVVVDEIGPMELYSRRFREVVERALDSDKVVLATIHWRAGKGEFGRKILSRRDIEILRLDFENRDRVPMELFEKIADLLKSRKRGRSKGTET